MKAIELTKGKEALVDDEDYDDLNCHCWCWVNCGYAHHRTLGYMHRRIMQPGPDEVVHHLNGDKLDNRRANLRVVSQEEHRRDHATNRPTTASSGHRWVKVTNYGYTVAVPRQGRTNYVGSYRSLALALAERNDYLDEMGIPHPD